MQLRTVLVAGFFAVAMPLSVSAQQAATKPDLAKARSTVQQNCGACHGADGNSAAAANPHLAGQHAEYIAKQLRDFKANKERKNPVMMGMAAALSDEDIRGLAQYFSEQKAKPGTAKDKDLVALGQKIYRGGNLQSGVAACAACHGPTGAGMPSQYPRLAGQFADYTAAQLKAFRATERANDPNEMMRGVAARMTDREIRAVAEYIQGLR